MKTLVGAEMPERGPEKLGDGSNRHVTVRLPEELVTQLMGLTVLDAATRDPSTTLADEMRGAFTSYVETRRHAPGFDDEIASARARITDTV